MAMKKSEIQSIIRECIEEVVAEQAVMQEAALMHDVEKFFATLNPNLKDSFKKLIFPLLQKSADNPEDKKRYVNDLIGAISNPAQVKGYILKLMNDRGIDLKRDAVELNKLLPILSQLQQYVSGQR